MIRNTLTLCSAALLLASCGGKGERPDPRGVDHDETLLSLSATGEAETVPDLAHIEIGVEGFAANAKDAGVANSRKAQAIADALEQFGVKPRDLQTRDLSINRIDYGKRKGQFQASNILRVTLRDAAHAGEAVAAATDAGANVISGPSLEISDPEKANRGAYIAAYRAARTRAEAYAEAAGMEIGRVLAIRDGGQGGGYPMPMDAMRVEMASDAAAGGPPPPVIRPGVSRVSVSVQVDFALEEK